MFWSMAMIVALLVGLALFAFAKEKGKDPMKWFAVGFASVLTATSAIFLWKKRKEKGNS